MDLETAEALEKSIKHWEENAVAEFLDVSISEDACALCDLFMLSSCVGCPVFKKTHRVLCANSPYATAAKNYGTWNELFARPKPGMSIEDARDAFRAAAREEVEFLKSLRETPDEK